MIWKNAQINGSFNSLILILIHIKFLLFSVRGKYFIYYIYLLRFQLMKYYFSLNLSW